MEEKALANNMLLLDLCMDVNNNKVVHLVDLVQCTNNSTSYLGRILLQEV